MSYLPHLLMLAGGWALVLGTVVLTQGAVRRWLRSCFRQLAKAPSAF